MPMKQARALGTVVLERLVAELRGVPSGVVETVEPQRRGLAVTRSFGTPVADFETLLGALAQYASRAGEKLRRHGLVAARLTAFFHTNRHRPDRPQYSASRTVALHPMTSDTLELLAAARRAAESAWRDGHFYTKARRYPRRPGRRRPAAAHIVRNRSRAPRAAHGSDRRRQ